ncbi:MAG: sugar phosphate isomerase/epimerase [Fuerstiella sp.]|nr:sugar phosphate isomerase/epimerase [Fuerstiella sp.]
MISGLVSNCWQQQLQADMPIENLIQEAVERGYKAVELRQTCLGEFESGPECTPDAIALSNFPKLFPTVRFNIAMGLPIFSTTLTPDIRLFQIGLEAALAVSGQFTPQLRLVDLTTQFTEQSTSKIQSIVESMSQLADAATRSGVVLSAENSIQPWSQFRRIMEQQRISHQNGSQIQLCYDAANLLLQPEEVDPDSITRSLRSTEISMVHFKQRGNGRFLESVRDGDINWTDQLAALVHINFDGPALFEIESSPAIWRSLDTSREYLRARGAQFE